MSEVKLCKDCKWFSVQANSSPLCNHQGATIVDYVTGGSKQMYCEPMRIRICAPNGILWEKRE